jgi:oxidase EvaA
MVDPQKAASLRELKDFLAASKIGFVVRPTGLKDMNSWRLSDGALSHISGGFFSVAGVQFEDEGNRQAIFLFQPQSALTGLLTCMMDGQRHFLLQARAEPGNIEKAQFGPTVQSTPANYLRAHGGKPSPYIDFFTTFQPHLRVLHDSMQIDYGERYLFKSKRLIIAECDPWIPVEAGFIWVPGRLINALVAESNFSTFDLRSLLVMFPWGESQKDALQPASPPVQSSLQLPARPEILGQVFHALQGRISRYRFCDLADMKNWYLSDRGLEEREARQGFDIGFYYVEARGREVASWSQPLVNSKTEGRASLVCRLKDDALEVLVRVAAESGLQTGKALLPSYLRYPGALSVEPPPSGLDLFQTIESDEGGRFFCDTSRYELIMNPDTTVPDGVWLRISELKFLLSQSNICAIQLRCLASMLLGTLRLPPGNE